MTHVVYTEIIQCLGNLNLLLGVKESIGELFTFSQGTFNDLEAGDVAQEVTDWLVRVRSLRGMRVLLGLDTSISWVSCN
jgi:hypothetical protein